MARLFHRAVPIVAVAFGTACIDKDLPVATTFSPLVSLQIRPTVSGSVAAAAFQVRVTYARQTGELVVLALEKRSVASEAADMRVNADLSTCLADAGRAGSPTGCTVHVTAELYDERQVLLDLVDLGVIDAVPGMAPKAIAATLVAAGTVGLLSSAPAATIGDTLRVSGIVRDPSGISLSSRVLTYTSSDTAIATVSAAGLVTLKSVGTVTITASNGTKVGTVVVSSAPLPVNTLAIGDGESCVLDIGGKAWCWGVNTVGQLGNGTTNNSLVPVAVSGGRAFVQISGGGASVCALTAVGEAFCWGSNAGGALGNDAVGTDSSIPVRVSGNLRFRMISVATVGFACGVTAEGKAYCWGLNRNGKLGVASTAASVAVPTQVSQGSLVFRSISSGLAQTCALTADNRAYCWGENTAQSLGLGTGVPSTDVVLEPRLVVGNIAFASISPGVTSCGLSTSGVTYCWGTERSGALGTGAQPITGTIVTTPTVVAGGLTFASMSITNSNNTFQKEACGLTATGAAFCWGSNINGALGAGTMPFTCPGISNSTTVPPSFGCASAPIPMIPSESFSAIAPGGGQICGITRRHQLLCWGWNVNGQVGDGTTVDRFAPPFVVPVTVW